MKKIYLSGDHAGFYLKNKLKKYLEKKYNIDDIGPLIYNKNDDYPDFVIPMARRVAKDKDSRGLVIAGSGQGESIATNKIKGIRAGLYHGKNLKFVKSAREHDNINVLCFGSRYVSEKEAKQVVNIFLNTKFLGGRHLRRIRKIEKIERLN